MLRFGNVALSSRSVFNKSGNPYGSIKNNNINSDNPSDKKDDGGFPKIDNEDGNPCIKFK